jgi:hypothetical protein
MSYRDDLSKYSGSLRAQAHQERLHDAAAARQMVKEASEESYNSSDQRRPVLGRIVTRPRRIGRERQ